MERNDGGTNGSVGYGLLVPEVLEWLFTFAVIAFLIWESAPFREPAFTRGAGDRYREAVELKAPILPQAAGIGRVVEICSRFGGWLPEVEREISAERAGVCHPDARHAVSVARQDPIDPAAIDELFRAYEALSNSLASPVKGRLARLGELE